MVGANRFEFSFDGKRWVLVPSRSLSAAQLQSAVPAHTAVCALDRWCGDPLVWGSLVRLFESQYGSISGRLTTSVAQRQIVPALRSTLGNGTWVALQSTSAVQTAALQIVAPARNAVFVMDDTPRMPSVDVVANVMGVVPDPTATTSFDWTAELRHNPRTAGDRNGPSRDFSTSATGSGVAEPRATIPARSAGLRR